MVDKKPRCPERLVPELLKEVQRLVFQQPWGPAVTGLMRETQVRDILGGWHRMELSFGELLLSLSSCCFQGPKATWPHL